MFENSLGRWLARQRTISGFWLTILIILLGGVLAINLLLLHPHHPHFHGEDTPGFWALFGLAGAVLMIFLLKKGLGPLLKRPEDIYERHG